MAVAVFFGQEHGNAQCPTTGNDGHLVERIVFRHQPADDGVACFVIRSNTFFLLRHDHRFALRAHHDPVLGLLEFVHFDQTLGRAGREQRRFIDQVREIRAGKSRRAARDNGQIHVIRDGYLADVNLQNLFAAANVRQADHDLTVEAPGPQQRRVEHVGTVGGRDDDDAVVRIEAVHLHQQLVQRLLTLVVATAKPRAAVSTHGVDLVDEDDAGCLLLRLLEHVAYPRRAHAHEHLHEVRAGDREERHLRLAGNGLGQQGLAGTRGTYHQNAPRDAPAQALKFARIAQELHQFLHVFLGLINPGHVGKRSLYLVLRQQPRFALAERHGAAATARTALHLAHEQHEDGDDDQDGEAGNQQLRPDALRFRRFADNHHAVADQIVHQLRIVNRRPDHLEAITSLAGTQDDQRTDPYFVDLILLDLGHKLRVRHLLGFRLDAEIVEHRQQNGCNNQPEKKIFSHIIQGLNLVVVVPGDLPSYLNVARKSCHYVFQAYLYVPRNRYLPKFEGNTVHFP